MKPPMGEDNGWWWKEAAEGRLAIQRCTQCQPLRHPPRPAQLINCAPADVSFGMPVQMVMHEDPDGFRLPMFQPATGAAA